MAVATEVIRRSMSTLAGLFTKKLPAGIWQFTFDEVGKGMKYVVNGRRYEFMAINGVMGITIDATNEKQLWYFISDDCTVQIEEVGQSANPFSSMTQEQGTWTPNIRATTPGDLSITFTSNVGHYTKVGNLVNIDFLMDLATYSNTTGSGTWEIFGLPFLVDAPNGALPLGQVAYSSLNISGTYDIALRGIDGSSHMTLLLSGDNTGWLGGSVSNLVMSSSTMIRGSLTYRTNQ
jgi:hypothetical protein